MNYHTLFLKTCQNIKFNEYGNHSSQKQKTHRILFIIGRDIQNWYTFNKNQFLLNFSSDRQVNCNIFFLFVQYPIGVAGIEYRKTLTKSSIDFQVNPGIFQVLRLYLQFDHICPEALN